ncbi:hypothetical protein HU200_031181 [Digitaria exilis]|uniref:Uncharacterized protein n=1 Tax=Digitaria exilis TaxID=1010633 RepID=A0A835BMI6_9POAL|nr:hypothetical protein HU200_031181 [Digitaria exilis]
MEKQAGSGIETGKAAEDTPSSGGAAAPPPRRRKKDWTPEERKAADEFIAAVIADYHVYVDMTEEDIVEEYRRAGKLHMYDAETVLQKRMARVAKKHPPPAGFYPTLEEYYKPFEEED